MAAIKMIQNSTMKNHFTTCCGVILFRLFFTFLFFNFPGTWSTQWSILAGNQNACCAQRNSCTITVRMQTPYPTKEKGQLSHQAMGFRKWGVVRI